MQRPTPEQYNPPLTPWGHVWRTAWCLGISTIAWWEIAPKQLDQAPGLFVIDVVLGVLAYVLMFFRRRWPLAIALVVTAFALLSATSAGPGALVFVSLATHRRLPQIAAVGAVSVIAGQLFFYIEPEVSGNLPWLNFTFIVVLTFGMAAAGMYFGSRRELIWTLVQRARQAEATQELQMDGARSAERERIAREMHDVLAHRISLVAMHAGALAYRDELPPEQVKETAGLIQAKAHEALNDLRQVLGMLRGESGQTRPQPTWTDLPALVGEAEESGLDVDYANSLPDAAPAPDQVGRTVYRIVQEALTNARKHGGGSRVEVRLSGGEEQGVDVLVRNGKRFGVPNGTTPGAGLGLIGLIERAELNGGRLEVDETHDSFTLRGWLPWRT